MTVRQYSQTDAFTLQYDDTFSDAQRRASALADSVEGDLGTMRDWFAMPDAFGPDDRCTVLVGQPTGGMADNFGYARNNSQIVVNPAQGWPSDAATQELCDNCCRAMFVMEFIEVMMSLRNQVQGTVTAAVSTS